MSASPAILHSTIAFHSNHTRLRRRPFSQRRIEANRRNALQSSGPRTPEGKARVASNAIKHGFFAATARWTPEQHRDFRETHAALRAEMQPLGKMEEYLIAEMALAFAKTAMVIRYERIAAVKFHREREDQLNAQIAAADPSERVRLERQRDQLKRAGLWKPTIPGERDARAVARYGASLDRRFHRALADFEALRDGRERWVAISKSQKQTHSRNDSGAPPPSGEDARRPSPGPARFSQNPRARSVPDRPLPQRARSSEKTQEQTHSGDTWRSTTAHAACAALTRPALRPQFQERPDAPATLSRKREREEDENAETNQLAGEAESCPEALRRTSNDTNSNTQNAKTNPFVGSDAHAENAKTNPLSAAFAGNRHERRRAEALDRKRRSSMRTDLDR